MKSIGAVELRVALPRWLNDGATGELHSVYRRVLNLCFRQPDAAPLLLSLYAHGGYAVPDSVALKAQDLETLRAVCMAGMPVRLTSEYLIAADYRIYFAGAARHSSGFAQTGGKAGCLPYEFESILAGNGFQRMDSGLSSRLMSALEELAAALLCGDTPTFFRELFSGLGCGYGLTPSFDDAVVGVLAVMARAGVSLPQPVDLCYLQYMEKKTTLVSLKYLCCAFQGRFSDQLLRLCDALFMQQEITRFRLSFLNKRRSRYVLGKDVFEHMSGLVRVGSTSGADMLAGVHLAVEVLNQRKRTPRVYYWRDKNAESNHRENG